MSAQTSTQRASPIRDVEFVVPADAPAWCCHLNMGEAEARSVITPNPRCTIGPDRLLRKGKYAAAVECRRTDAPFVTYDSHGKGHGIFGSWAGAAMDLVRLAQEFERERGK